MIVCICIRLKEEVRDPQGDAIARTLRSLGFDTTVAVSQGKWLEISIDESDPDKARQRAQEMCQALLVHPAIERYDILLPSENPLRKSV